MKDPQIPSETPKGGIPIISPILHYLAMPVILFCRCNFGYGFLSPKSVFLSSIFTCCALSYIVWHEPELKFRYWTTCLFFVTASFLYIINLANSIRKEVGVNAEHDRYSGTSYILLFWPPQNRERLEGFTHIFFEPLLTIVLGIVISPNPLGNFLVVIGAALALKALITAWLGVRKKKRFKDGIEDAGETMDKPEQKMPASSSTHGRTESERYKRVNEKDAND